MMSTLSAIRNISNVRTIRTTALLGFAGLSAAGAMALSGSPAQAAAPTPPAQAPAPTPPAQGHVASYDGALQPNYYYCAPAATRIALTAHGQTPSFDDLANDLGTTTDGTKSINEVTRVLNKDLGDAHRYQAIEFSGTTADAKQVEELRVDTQTAINRGDVVVANIAGTVTDTAGEAHSYNGGHYLTITGYTDNGKLVTVTDPADTHGSNEYQMPVDQMANWIATHGYTF
jgi:hypothetical protein